MITRQHPEEPGLQLLSCQIPCSRSRMSLFGICCFIAASTAAPAADFVVTSPGFFYQIGNVSPNPTITLERGKTYTFQVNTASNHPFEILSAGVTNNNIFSGTITYKVPLVASNYHYICSIHGFGGTIATVAPAPPPAPTIRILSLSVGTN